MVRSAAVAYALTQLKISPALHAIAGQLQQLWMESTQVAALSYVLATRTRVNPDEAYLAGLLHAMGRVYILARIARHPELLATDQSLDQIMRSWHATIGKTVLHNWMLPENMCEAVGEQDEMSRKHYGEADLTDILACAKHVRLTVHNLPALSATITGADCFRQLRLRPDDCVQLLAEARKRADLLRAAVC